MFKIGRLYKELKEQIQGLHDEIESLKQRIAQIEDELHPEYFGGK